MLSGLFELRHAGEGDAADRRDDPRDGARVRRRLRVDRASCSRYLARHTIGVFVAYRVVLGVLVLSLAAGGVIS